MPLYYSLGDRARLRLRNKTKQTKKLHCVEKKNLLERENSRTVWGGQEYLSLCAPSTLDPSSLEPAWSWVTLGAVPTYLIFEDGWLVIWMVDFLTKDDTETQGVTWSRKTVNGRARI